MSRTTVDIDDPILKELKRMQRQEKKSLGRLVSDLLAEAISLRLTGGPQKVPAQEWVSRPMGARVDLTDREALRGLLDQEEAGGSE